MISISESCQIGVRVPEFQETFPDCRLHAEPAPFESPVQVALKNSLLEAALEDGLLIKLIINKLAKSA